MTQYLLGQIEELQKIENEHQNHFQSISNHPHITDHANCDDLAIYNSAYENTVAQDDDGF